MGADGISQGACASASISLYGAVGDDGWGCGWESGCGGGRGSSVKPRSFCVGASPRCSWVGSGVSRSLDTGLGLGESDDEELDLLMASLSHPPLVLAYASYN